MWYIRIFCTNLQLFCKLKTILKKSLLRKKTPSSYSNKTVVVVRRISFSNTENTGVKSKMYQRAVPIYHIAQLLSSVRNYLKNLLPNSQKFNLS